MLPGFALGAEPTANLCEGFEVGNERVLIPAVARPPFGRYYRDPAFGGKVIRISESVEGEVFKPAYNTMQAWNADESLLLLYRGGVNGNSAHLLLDGHTYEVVRELDIQPSDIEDIFWSYADPDVFFYVSRASGDHGDLRRFHVRENRSERIRRFDDICGKEGLPSPGTNVQMQSYDDDLFGFRCRVDEERYVAFTYRMSTDEVHTLDIGKGTQWEVSAAPSPAPSGERVWLQGKVLSPELGDIELEQDLANPGEHASLGKAHDGRDTLFMTVFDPSPDGCEGDTWSGVGHLVAFGMEDDGCHPIIGEGNGYGYTTRSTHVSAVAWKRPGWVAMSSIGNGSFEFFSNGRKAPPLLSEIYLANTDPDNRVVCRLAHHRSFGKSAEHGGYHPYLGEPHATISPSATRILFGSDWYDSGSVDAYVIELPAYRAP